MTGESKGPKKLHRLRISEDEEPVEPGDLEDLPAGEYFAADLEEARALAEHEPRFERLVEGLQAATMGERVAAITACFDQFSTAEIANLTLPPHLSQLREIYLSSRSDWP
jgi:hypothetical protein